MERVYLKDLGLQYNYSELENRNKTDMIIILIQEIQQMMIYLLKK